VSEPSSRAQRMAARVAARREAHAKRSKAYRIGFTAAGVTVTAAGFAMLVLPGPALVVIPVGLAMLALEFSWAEKALNVALARAEQAEQTAREASPARKALTIGALATAAAAFVVLAILYDIPLLPV
jgi:uncharacterized protein (TIGR02611 family)